MVSRISKPEAHSNASFAPIRGSCGPLWRNTSRTSYKSHCIRSAGPCCISLLCLEILGALECCFTPEQIRTSHTAECRSSSQPFTWLAVAETTSWLSCWWAARPSRVCATRVASQRSSTASSHSARKCGTTCPHHDGGRCLTRCRPRTISMGSRTHRCKYSACSIKSTRTCSHARAVATEIHRRRTDAGP